MNKEEHVLAHYGKLGMKWGRRKGSDVPNIPDSPDHIRAVALRKKKLSQLSNEEVQLLVARATVENQYRALHPSKVAKGQKIVSDILAENGKQAFSAVVRPVMIHFISKAFEKTLGIKLATKQQ